MANKNGKIISLLESLGDKGADVIQRITCSIKGDCSIGKDELDKIGLPPSRIQQILYMAAQEGGSRKRDSVEYNGTRLIVREEARKGIFSCCKSAGYPTG